MKVVLVALSALALALACGAGAAPRVPAAPTGLHAFLLSPSEAPLPYYPRTPSFTWNPESVRGGTYDFQLATSRTFTDSGLLFSYTGVKIPAVAVDHQLPWMTGDPFAVWVRVRWESPGGKVVTPWGKAFGFNMRWLDSDLPQQMPAPTGLVRWKPIEGATRYQVLYPDVQPNPATFETTTNVGDLREFFTLHEQFGWGKTIHWRVRAIRYIDDSDLLKNGLPRATYGPWSTVFSTVIPPRSAGFLSPLNSLSDTWDSLGNATTPHDLTPGFSWNPSDPYVTSIANFGSSLYRVYVFTDNHCVNQVFTGSIVGSPAFAPRVQGGPLGLPPTLKVLGYWMNGFVKDGGGEGAAYDATSKVVVPNEDPNGASTSSGSSSSSSTPSASTDAHVDLWDSGWPTGRFYWTVVPVSVERAPDEDPSKPAPDPKIQYDDMAVPQDQCEAGHMMSFGKTSQPVVASANTPYVSGLSPNGRVVASASKVPTVHDSPLVAWQPAVGATAYEVQLSRAHYPWKVTWDKVTPATATVLPLSAKDVGTWWYRVRGINPALPAGAQTMTWSTAIRIRISGDRYVKVK